MNYGLQYLAHLVQTKNELNRKRRRFYKWANYYKLEKTGEYWSPKFPKYKRLELEPKVMTRMFALEMYGKAKQDMRAMTAEIRKARKEIGASLIWGESGNVQAIRIGNEWLYLKDIARQAELYKADAILLGD